MRGDGLRSQARGEDGGARPPLFGSITEGDIAGHRGGRRRLEQRGRGGGRSGTEVRSPPYIGHYQEGVGQERRSYPGARRAHCRRRGGDAGLGVAVDPAPCSRQHLRRGARGRSTCGVLEVPLRPRHGLGGRGTPAEQGGRPAAWCVCQCGRRRSGRPLSGQAGPRRRSQGAPATCDGGRRDASSIRGQATHGPALSKGSLHQARLPGRLAHHHAPRLEPRRRGRRAFAGRDAIARGASEGLRWAAAHHVASDMVTLATVAFIGSQSMIVSQARAKPSPLYP